MARWRSRAPRVPRPFRAKGLACAGGGRVGVPGRAARQVAGGVGQGLVAGEVLAQEPENAVAVVDAPDRGERVAQAEVEAADTGTADREPVFRQRRRESGDQAAGE